MKIEKVIGLGEDALKNPGKYNGFLGVSVYNYFFTKKVMEEYILWGSKQFTEFLIVIMDDPEKYNLSVFQNISQDEGLSRARTHAQQLKVCFERIVRKYNLSNVRVLVFNDFSYDENYIEKLEVTRGAMLNLEFRKDVISLMEVWIGDKIIEKSVSNEDKENILVNYIIEELASLFYFTERGFKIELDPAPEFRTKRKVYDGEFENIGKALKVTRRGHIYLHPEGFEKYGEKKKKEVEEKLSR